MEDRCRRGAVIAVEHHRSARHARREDGARNGSQLAAAEPAKQPPGIALRVAVALHRARHQRRRSEEHTSELQSLMRISYAVFCFQKLTQRNTPYYATYVSKSHRH